MGTRPSGRRRRQSRLLPGRSHCRTRGRWSRLRRTWCLVSARRQRPWRRTARQLKSSRPLERTPSRGPVDAPAPDRTPQARGAGKRRSLALLPGLRAALLWRVVETTLRISPPRGTLGAQCPQRALGLRCRLLAAGARRQRPPSPAEGSSPREEDKALDARSLRILWAGQGLDCAIQGGVAFPGDPGHSRPTT